MVNFICKGGRKKSPAKQRGTQSWPFSPPPYAGLSSMPSISGSLLNLEPTSYVK